MTGRRVWLNIGSGPVGGGLRPPGLQPAEWCELRLDADPAVQPDVLAPAHDLSALSDASVDAVFSSHCIEHLYLDQAVPALREWRRVLRDDGFLLLVCPDLQAAAEMVAHDRLFDVAYAGIRPYDLIFSHQGLVAQGRAQGHSFMEHKSGYTLSSLRQCVSEAGFAMHAGMRLRPRFELWLLATKTLCTEPQMRALATAHFMQVSRPVKTGVA
jgi:SAM-dependent methyltransferase